MNKTENVYCRLCAQLKPKDKLINLKTNDETCNDIVNKLSRLNIEINENIYPKTVCFICINSLQNAHEFVMCVEQAQTVLNNLLFVQPIKKEENFSDDNVSVDNFTYEPPVEVCSEDIVVKLETKAKEAKHKPLLNTEMTKVCKKKDICNTLDAVPLSQLKLTWKDYSWKCSYCETQFASIDELRNHSMEYHNACNAYRCTDCNVRKIKLNKFLLHVCNHRKYLKFSCYKCLVKFSTSQQGNYHKSKHINSNYICFGCNTNFSSREELRDHASKFYKEWRIRNHPVLLQKDGLTCLICKKTFKGKGGLDTHLLTHTERPKDHVCDVCGKSFYQKSTLIQHITLHSDARPHQCELCKFSFKTSRQLQRHIGIHDGNKPFACDQCGKCFRLRSHLINHSIIHTDSLPHVCSYCNKRFRFKTILNQHIRQHTGVKPYSCDSCQRDFTNWPNYNKHMKRRHGTDMSRKKRTSDGVYPVNPATGDVIYPEAEKIIEWKKKVLDQGKTRPKARKKSRSLLQCTETN